MPRLALFLLATSAFAQLGQPRVITVTGEAEVKVAPDRVVLFLGVETRSKSLAAATAANDERVRAVLDVARRASIEAGDIQTDFIQVDMAHNRDDQTVVDYYIVRKSIVLTLRAVDRFEGVLTAVLNAGANHVHGVEFETTQLRRHRDEARAAAVKAATEKARDMAAAAGLQIGRAESVSSYNYGGRAWYGSGWYGSRGGQMTQNVVLQPGRGGEAEGTIALGRISVTASVTMSFRLTE